MKKIKFILGVAVLAAVINLHAQTNSTPASVLTTLESYMTQNDTNYNGWASNHFVLWEGAAFASVNGTAGESAIGNDLGLELPIHKYSLHLDSVTRFEQLFGDVSAQSIGVAYDYTIHQVQLSAGLDGRYIFVGNHAQAVPYIEGKKASTLLYGLSPMIRYGLPIQRKPGAGEVDVAMCLSF